MINKRKASVVKLPVLIILRSGTIHRQQAAVSWMGVRLLACIWCYTDYDSLGT